MKSRHIFAAGVGVVAAVIGSAVAMAGTVYPSPGSPLQLGATYLSGSATTASSNAVNNDLTANGASSYTYADGWATGQTAIAPTLSGSATTYGFYDDFVFTVDPSAADSITSTINLTSGGVSTQLKNLDVQLFMLSGNASLPGFTPQNTVNDTLGTTNFTLNSNVTGTTVVLDPTQILTAGTYVLQVRGYADGNAGGSYSGVLDVTPVPLSPALPLLLSGLGVLGVAGRRRSAIARVSLPA